MLKKRKKKSNKGIFIIYIIYIFIINFIFNFNFNGVRAYDAAFIEGYNRTDSIGGSMQILVGDLKNQWLKLTEWIEHKAIIDAQKLLEEARGKVFKTALGHFLNQLAYDTATYLATGDKGQKPMFITDSWGSYFKQTADEAAGIFIEDLGRQGFSGVRFNLCEPDFNVGAKIIIGLQLQQYEKRTPECTFSQMKNNWEAELKDPNFLNRFQSMFNPWENDLGIALTAQTQLGAEVDKAVRDAEVARLADGGFKPVADKISGYIRTPARAVMERMGLALKDATGKEKIFTGTVADAIDVFINTLVGKLMDKWFNEGLVTNFPGSGSRGEVWDLGYESQAGTGGAAAAKQRFRSLVEPQFGVRGDYNILSELVQCIDPTKAGPTNCVITESFRQAIENRLTVGQAMDQGYLNPSGIFGFTADGLEPAYYEGYPYRSMIILRKYRIIPAGWEIAAQYIQGFGNETLNLGDLIACYDIGDGYTGYNEVWCRGLVDPNWVLKAPLNYCGLEGPGPEIVSDTVVGSGEASVRAISRDESYCADEQTCILENSDGSCQFYGYCTEDRRRWEFNGTSCDPKYNTCQTFQSRGGETISFLQNTLNYNSNCTADTVGCLAYCTDASAITGGQVDWSWDAISSTGCDGANGLKIHLDRDARECDESAEGCHEFIRTRAGLGANLLLNSSFEELAAAPNDFEYWGVINTGASINEGYAGAMALELSTGGWTSPNIEVGPASYSRAFDVYTLSFYAKDCSSGGDIDEFRINDPTAAIPPAFTPIRDSMNWEFHQATYLFPATAAGNTLAFTFSITSASCKIDAIKLERGESATAYSSYGEKGIVYQKLAPDWLGCSGAGAPDECNDFVRRCTAEDVGCNLYTSVTSGITVPGQVSATDYCAAECVGYDGYIQQPTLLESRQSAYFIPNSAKACGASAVGCEEFTNLDEVARGGEGREYFTYIRQCLKPTSPNCGQFYTWEGNDETGYQLKAFVLERDTDGDCDGVLGDPNILQPDCSACNAAINALPQSDPSYDSDCREFYNSDGEISYHLYSHTRSCEADCHPYRKTHNNIDPSCDNAGCCVGSYKSWDAALGVCYFCKNSGRWDSGQGACIYDAVPSQGIRCSAGQAGCREYTGNAGNNMRIVLNHDFEASLLESWAAGAGTTIENSTESLFAGEHSLAVKGPATTITNQLGDLVSQGKSYILTFMARSAGASFFNKIYFDNGAAGEEIFFVENASPYAFKSGEWDIYKFNLTNDADSLDHAVSANESIVIEANGDYYIDNIRLIEVIDRYYLIKESWNTPDACLEDLAGNYVGPYWNAGCDKYLDQENDLHHLRNFSRLCEEGAIGCEIMIDTQNTSDYYSQTWNDESGNGLCEPAEADCVYADRDQYDYIVYNSSKACGQLDKGCSRLGEPYQILDKVIYTDIFKINDPDQYNKTLCASVAVGCEEWKSGGGFNYFNDPGDMICEWRQAYGVVSGNWDWMKKTIKRCDTDADGIGDGDPCLSAIHCAGGRDCLAEAPNQKCASSAYQSLGYGGAGNAVSQPTTEFIGGVNYYWAGICPSEQSGCAEYIDPISYFSPNILYNNDFTQNVDLDNIPDGWSAEVDGRQKIDLTENTLYILELEIRDDGDPNNIAENTATITTPAGTNAFYELTHDNTLFGPNPSITLKGVEKSKATISFYTRNYLEAIVTVADSSVHYKGDLTSNRAIIRLKKAVIDYQLSQTVDKKSCNGVVDVDQGCILFNERAQDGFLKSSLIWESDNSGQNPERMNCDAGGGPLNGYCVNSLNKAREPLSGVGCASDNECTVFNNANKIIKVVPDRVCNKWLSCRSMVAVKNESGEEESVCFDIGLCDSLDKNGNCQNFLISDMNNQTYDGRGLTSSQGCLYNINIGDISNMTGYVKTGHCGSSENSDYYPLGAMNQIGELAEVPNGSFEEAGGNGYPTGWQYGGSAQWDQNLFKAVIGPYNAQAEGIDKAPVGQNFLKMGSSFNATSEFISIESNVNYVLTAYINTLNLSNGEAIIKIRQYDNSGKLVPGASKKIITLNSGNDWKYVLGRFTTNANATRIKIILEANPDATTSIIGNYYFDDIKLKPALETKWFESQNKNWLTPQTCRIYPQNNALSCEYIDDTGMKQKGSYGYCLEYDRYPGSSDNCLLWWPVDKVKGEGIEEGAGYREKMPLYYTVDLSNFGNWPTYRSKNGEIKITPDPSANPASLNNDCNGVEGCYHYWGKSIPTDDGGTLSFTTGFRCNSGWSIMRMDRNSKEADDGANNRLFNKNFLDNITVSLINKNEKRYAALDDVELNEGNGWKKHMQSGKYENWAVSAIFNAKGNYKTLYLAVGDASSKCNDSTDHYGDIVVEFNFRRFGAQTIVQVVTPAGQNKYWSGRVYEGSDYNFPCNNGLAPLSQICDYKADDPPFGSVVPPFPNNNPYEWDSKTNLAGNQPLYYEAPNGQARMGQLHTTGSIKLIFAQSYGSWSWNGSNYIETSNNWGPPLNSCTDSTREASATDFCAYAPKIFNIMVNNQNRNNVIIGKNQFINLSFNTKVDAQQLPMVMYSVDWGDNEYTTVTGVEMRDRPNTDNPNTPDIDEGNPHTLYHLYSYWDLRAKNAVDQTAVGGSNSIYCGNAGEEACNFAGLNTAGGACGSNTGVICSAGEACCAARPSIKIKDNWGWCNNGINGNPCPLLGYQNFTNWIIVRNAVITQNCIADGCNGYCPPGCRALDDPDCGGLGCCGDGVCNHLNHPTNPGMETNPGCIDCLGICTDYECNGICGNSCTGAEDPDCAAPFVACCGDGVCNVAAGEDASCSDCSSVCFTDGLCDGACPANCEPGDDPDCLDTGVAGAACIGNGVCDPGENEQTAPSDCACPSNGCNGVCPANPACVDGYALSSDPDCRGLGCCGDSVLDAGNGEECDEGPDNSNTQDACRENCLLPTCGDYIIDSGEECDDGGMCADNITFCASDSDCGANAPCTPRSGDGCSSNCLTE